MIYNRSENELVLHIARRELDAGQRAELRRLLRQPLNWDYLLAIAHAHGLSPLLQKHLCTVGGDLVPSHFLSRLKRESVANSQSVLHLIGKQLRVYKLFKEHGLPAALFKGPLLSKMAYGEISLRQAGDIDLLISREHFNQARVLLESLGYEMYPRLTSAQLASHLNYHCELPFVRDDGFTVVDLSRLQTVSVCGTEVETFSDEDLVLYQAMHGAKHLWRRLEWISALAESLRAMPSVSWDTIVERATTARATRILGLGLRLVEQFSEVNVPSDVLAVVDADGAMQRMAAGIRDQLFTTFGPADSTETNLYNLRVMDRKRDALVAALRAIFVPTLPDWQSLALPAPLHLLYYAYRPLRLSKAYTTSIWRRVKRDV
jgi:hypothetical protein